MFEITDEFLHQAGFSQMTGDTRERLRDSVTKSVDGKIKQKVIFAVGEDKLKDFAAVIEGDNPAEVVTWCQANGVDIVQIVQGAMNDTMAELQQLNHDALNALRS